jgi:undecaprenyl-diphosphatase
VRAFSRLGEHGLLWQGIALVGAAVDAPRRRRWLRAWAVIAGSFGANQLVKLLIRRPRPDLPELPRLMKTTSNRSYPSAHATTSAAAARVLPPLLEGPVGRIGGPLAAAAVAPLFASVAVAMALSRLYLGVHWPSDTAAGVALGSAVAELGS